MAGIISGNLGDVIDHLSVQTDRLVDLLIENKSADATRLFNLTIQPFLEDLDATGRIANQACLAIHVISNDLERAKAVVAFAQSRLYGYKSKIDFSKLHSKPPVETPQVVRIPKAALPPIPEKKPSIASLISARNASANPIRRPLFLSDPSATHFEVEFKASTRPAPALNADPFALPSEKPAARDFIAVPRVSAASTPLMTLGEIDVDDEVAMINGLNRELDLASKFARDFS